MTLSDSIGNTQRPVALAKHQPDRSSALSLISKVLNKIRSPRASTTLVSTKAYQPLTIQPSSKRTKQEDEELSVHSISDDHSDTTIISATDCDTDNDDEITRVKKLNKKKRPRQAEPADITDTEVSFPKLKTNDMDRFSNGKIKHSRNHPETF